MTFRHVSLIHVYYMRGTEKCPMGRLALKNRKIFFEYDLEFLKTELELSPFILPLKSGVISSEDRLFEGLFGVFNDSLPDGWGRLLIDRKLMTLGIHPGALSPLDRLCYVGSHGMGALVYEPEIESPSPLHHEDLDEIANEAFQFQENDDDQFVDDLLSMNGSSAGARPKILVNLEGDALNKWIIKFRSSIDPKDIGSIEYAYHLMAKAAGLEVPEARMFKSKKSLGYFGVKRFDSIGNKRLHMHTISGLLHIDHRIPSLDYETLMKATLWLTKDARECEKQFKAAVFNVLAHNRDDHAKNFSFLMDEQGTWRVSPSYDLTFSSGIAAEHCTMLMGEGKTPTLELLLKLAEVGGIKKQPAIEMIDEVRLAISQWPTFANDAGVTKKSAAMIQAAIQQVHKLCC
jgi:serine/threonine-protein kinase HipA